MRGLFVCGIFGFNWNDKTLLQKMSSVLKYRGPDYTGFYEDNSISLGHNRLSIIDTSKSGNQPIFNEDETVLVICNGEIYNYKEFKNDLLSKGHIFKTNSDSEVLVHLYEEYGISFIRQLNGIFSFAIYDLTKKKIILARDHIGVKPLYYYHQKSEFIFASELKAIIQHDTIKREFNSSQLSSYLTFRYVPGSETLMKHINKLEPAQVLVFDLITKTKRIHKYWDFNIQPSLSYNASLDILQKQLKKSVDMQLMSDVPVGVFLSGGLDSSSILSLMSSSIKANDLQSTLSHSGQINSFVVGYEHSSVGLGDLQSAKLMAEEFETNHHEILLTSKSLNDLPEIIWQIDEPISDATAIPTYHLAKEANKSVKVVLTGEGADEIFGGYVQYKMLQRLKTIQPYIPFKKQLPNLVSLIPVDLLSSFFDYPGSIGEEGKQRLQELVTNLHDETKNYLSMISVFSAKEKNQLLSLSENENSTKNNNLMKNKNFINNTVLTRNIKQTYFKNKQNYLENIFIRENKTWLPEYILPRLDRMTMAHSIEGRVPLLDKNLVSLSCKIPRKYKQNKQIFRDAMKHKLPKLIVNRKKYPFSIPIDEWFTREKSDLIEKSLFKSKFVQSHFSKKYLEKIFTKQKSNVLHSRQLWSITNLSLWHELFIENNTIKD